MPDHGCFITGDGVGCVLRGREPELARLVEVLDSAVTVRRGTLVSIEGGAGVGKTALLREMTAAAVARGFQTALLRHEELRPDALADLVGGAGTEARDWRLVRNGGPARGPLLISVDDFDGGEPASRAVETLCSRATTRPLVCVLASLPDSGPSRLGRLFRSADDRDAHVRLPLGRLPDEAVAAVVKDMLGAAPDAALTELVACAEGNAAALTELVDGLVRERMVHREGNFARLTPGFAGISEGSQLPECLGTLVCRAMSKLSPQTRQTLEVAAVLGRTFLPDDVTEMLQQPVPVLMPAFREAIGADVLDCTADRLRFRHDLIRQALLHGIPVPVRGALHRQAAKILLAQGRSAIDSAEHLLRGAVQGDGATAELLHEAARQALRSAPGVAADLAARGLEMTAAGSRERVPLTMIAVEACARSGSLPAAVALAQDAATWDLSPELAGTLRYWLFTALTLQDRHAEAAEAASGLPSGPGIPAGLSRRLALNRSTAAVVRGVHAAAQHAGQAAAPCPLLAWQAGQAETALQMARDALEGEDAALPVTWIGHPRMALALILTGLRDDRRAQAAIADVERDVDYALSVLPRLMRARLDLASGRSSSAAGAAIECLAFARETGMRLHLPATLAVLATVELRGGDLAANVPGDELVTWAAAQLAGPRAVTLEFANAQLALAQDDRDSFLQFLEWISRDDGSRSALCAEEPTAAAWIVRTTLATGRPEWAAAAADTADRLAKDNPDVRPAAMAAAHARGLLHGDTTMLALAAEGHEDPWARASATEDLGIALAATDREAAVTRLEAAVALYGSVHAERDTARGRSRLRALGVVKRHWTRQHNPATGTASLTETERIVASLVAEGLTNRQVASRMYISPHTVAFHLRKTFAKLGIRSRTQLARTMQPDTADTAAANW